MDENEEFDNRRESSVFGYLFELMVLLVCSMVLGCGFGIAFCLTVCQYVSATIVVKTNANDSGITLEHRVIDAIEEEFQNDGTEDEEPLPEVEPTVPETPEELDDLTALHMLGIDTDEKVPVPQYEQKKDDFITLIPHRGANILSDDGKGKTKNLK
ncbi:MAG: hypothetical protein ACI4NP_00480 [Thermoguttaceae bacterium]